MSYVSTSQAAILAKVSKRTIHNNIKAGKISSSRDERGYHKIEMSELLRVYPDMKQQAIFTTKEHMKAGNKDATDKEINIALEKENHLLKQHISRLEKYISASEERESKLLETNSMVTRILEHKTKVKKKKFLGIF